jgi:hypothetical protein
MRRIGTVLVLVVALMAFLAPSYAGMGWGTLADEVAIRSEALQSESDSTLSPYFLLWTALLPVVL